MCGICVSTWPMLESLAVSLQSCCWLPQKRGDLGRCFFQRPEQSPPRAASLGTGAHRAPCWVSFPGAHHSFSVSRTGSVPRQTHLPNTGSRLHWCPRRRRRKVCQVGRSVAASPRRGLLRSPCSRCPHAGTTGPQEAETRGPGAPPAGRWEPAGQLRSERGGWQAGGARPGPHSGRQSPVRPGWAS